GANHLRVLGKSPRREENIVIQYDDGVSCARRNAEIEGGRFSFILLTKVAYRFSKCRCDTPGIVRGPVVDDQDFPISVRLRQKRRQTTHLGDVPAHVTVTRKHHAFEGHTLPVISSIKGRGVLLALVILPNGSRSLIPRRSLTGPMPTHRRARTIWTAHRLPASSVICSSLARSSTLS